MKKLLAGLAVAALLAVASPAQANGQRPEGAMTLSTTTPAVGQPVTATASNMYVPQVKKGSYALLIAVCPSFGYVAADVTAGGTLTFTDSVAETCEVYLRVWVYDPSGTTIMVYTLADVDVVFS